MINFFSPRPGRAAAGWRAALLPATLLLLAATFVGSVAALVTYGAQARTNTARGAQLVNLTARQRMLSQRLCKALLLLADDRDHHRAAGAALDEVKLAAGLFDRTLGALLEGGTTTGADGKPATLEALRDPAARAAAERGSVLWRPLRQACDQLGAGDPATGTPGPLREALALVRSSGVPLLDQMNLMTVAAEESTARAGDRLAQRANLFTGLAAASFLGIAGLLYGRSRADQRRAERSARELAAAAQRLTAANGELAERTERAGQILSTVTEGLLLISPEGVILPEHSEALGRILQVREPAGRNLLDLIRASVPAHEFGPYRDYVDLLLHPDVREELIGELNPLAEAEFHLRDDQGRLVTKSLQFRFRRVYQGDRIARLFVTISDVTEKVRLARELESSGQRTQEQMEMLFGLLHVDRSALQEFLRSTKEQLTLINLLLREDPLRYTRAMAPGARQDYLRTLAQKVAGALHLIKGNARMLRIDYFVQLAHRAEERVAALARQPRMDAEDFLPVVVELSGFSDQFRETEAMMERLVAVVGQPAAAVTPAAAVPAGTGAPVAAKLGEPLGTAERLCHLAADVAARAGKRVRVVCQTPLTEWPEASRQPVTDALIQLVRNAVVHGIESPARRQEAGKPAEGTVTIGAFTDPTDRRLWYTVTDDGAGLDAARLRARGVELGLLTPERARRLSDEELAYLLFEPGFSTATEVTIDAGRGTGLAAAREAVARLDGEIRVRSQAGRSCEFFVGLPPRAAAPAAAAPATRSLNGSRAGRSFVAEGAGNPGRTSYHPAGVLAGAAV